MIRKVLPRSILVMSLITFSALSHAQSNAQAQTRRKVSLEVSVPFEFVIGNRAFPAGTYVFEMATGSPKLTDHAGVLVVRNHERKLYTAVAADVAADSSPHVSPKLVFNRRGERVYLSKVWRQGNIAGLSVHHEWASTGQEWQESEAVTLDATIVGEAL